MLKISKTSYHGALQNPRTKLWDIYGTVLNVSPHRRYSLKSHAGRVLVRNRRFLRFRSPASTITHDGGSPQPPTSTQPAGRVQNPILPQNSSQGAPIQHSQTLPPRAPRRLYYNLLHCTAHALAHAQCNASTRDTGMIVPYYC